MSLQEINDWRSGLNHAPANGVGVNGVGVVPRGLHLFVCFSICPERKLLRILFYLHSIIIVLYCSDVQNTYILICFCIQFHMFSSLQGSPHGDHRQHSRLAPGLAQEARGLVQEQLLHKSGAAVLF